MALLKFFRMPRHQRYEYKPRFWDPKKEAMDEKIDRLKKLKAKDPESIKARISGGFRQGGGGYEEAARARRRQTIRSNMFLLAIIVALVLVTYLLLSVYLPRIIQLLEG